VRVSILRATLLLELPNPSLSPFPPLLSPPHFAGIQMYCKHFAGFNGKVWQGAAGRASNPPAPLGAHNA